MYILTDPEGPRMS